MSDMTSVDPFSAPLDAPGSALVQSPDNALTTPAPPDPGGMLGFIAMALTNRNIDAAKLKALLDMQREVVADQAKVEFNAALHAAQAEMPRVAKNGTIKLGDKGSIPFATWEDIDTALRPIMSRHGFTLSFDMAERGAQGGGAVITGTLTHTAGHSKSVSMPLALDSGPGRNNLQAMGSTLSYGRRYCAEMLFNIVREGADDDGKRGGTVYITGDQIAEVEALLAETKADRVAFLRFANVPDVTEIEAKNFVTIRNALLKKRKAAP